METDDGDEGAYGPGPGYDPNSTSTGKDIIPLKSLSPFQTELISRVVCMMLDGARLIPTQPVSIDTDNILLLASRR